MKFSYYLLKKEDKFENSDVKSSLNENTNKLNQELCYVKDCLHHRPAI